MPSPTTRPPPTGLRHSPSDPVIIRGGGPELAPAPTDTRPPYGSYTRHAHPPPPPAAALDPDMDGFGNICDVDDDGDGVLDVNDCATVVAGVSTPPGDIDDSLRLDRDGAVVQLT